jgi:periplasmic divalent cation tolerance protein
MEDHSCRSDVIANTGLVVFVTVSSEDEAIKISRAVVEARLAACANIVPGVRSIFCWEGNLSEEREVLVVLKSKAELFDELASLVKSLHSYQVPEIIALSIVKVTRPYWEWMDESMRK